MCSSDLSAGLPRLSRALLRVALAAAVGALLCPTWPALAGTQVFPVSIQNNLTEPVVVRDCDSYCSSLPIDITLPPGARTQINSATGDHKFFAITSQSGQHLGCIDLFFASPESGASVPVSHTVKCPGSSLPWLAIVAGVAVLVVAIVLLLRPSLSPD